MSYHLGNNGSTTPSEQSPGGGPATATPSVPAARTYNRWYKVTPAVLEWFRSRYQGNQGVDYEIVQRAPVELVYVGYSPGGGWLAFRRGDGSQGEIQGTFSDPPADIAPQRTPEEVDAVFASMASDGAGDGTSTKVRPRVPEDKSKKAALYIGVGAGVAFAVTVGYMLLSRKKAPMQANRRRTSRALGSLRENASKKWYVLRAPAGRELVVEKALRNQIVMREMSDSFGEILVPIITKTVKHLDYSDPKDPTKKKFNPFEAPRTLTQTVHEALYPTYIYVQIAEPITPRVRFLLKATQGAQGLLPTPVTDEEIAEIREKMGSKDPLASLPIEEGSEVEAVSGSFKGFSGKVKRLIPKAKSALVTLEIYGRATDLALPLVQLKLAKAPKPKP